MDVKIKKLHPNFHMPEYKTLGASGADVYAVEDRTIYQGQIVIVPLGFAVELPIGYEMQLRPRSSMALKGILLPNTPATIDRDYRGEVGVILMNMFEQPYEVKVGDRIAQAIIKETTRADYILVEKLTESIRSTGGYGSTG